MAKRRVEIGPTGEIVRANVLRLRKQQGLALRDVADRLKEIGHPMAHNTVNEIERGARRVDTDDLVALAAALGTSPAMLLMPTAEPDQDAVITGHRGKLACGRAWEWITGQRPASDDVTGADLLAWFLRSRPHWTIELTGHVPTVKVSDGHD